MIEIAGCKVFDNVRAFDSFMISEYDIMGEKSYNMQNRRNLALGISNKILATSILPLHDLNANDNIAPF
jgi:hypothetical protein